jgi:asparagine synthase (glutamine-hydrolysing)
MCGITGIFEYGTTRPINREQLRRMNDTLRHRGPDDAGSFCAPGVGLAMRRLAIIDRAGGQQPISNEDDSIQIVFNGEIYNFHELRDELLKRNHQFKTRSDTEVILHLYEDYGAECVQHLDGMFAFAIYDGRPTVAGAGRLLLARDRLGKKPLYYADLGDALLFGSELKPLLQDPRVSREVDLEALNHYLSLQVVPAPHSIFKAIRKLPAGCLLEADARGVRVRRYWDYQTFVGDQQLPEQEAVAEIRRLIFAAIEKRLIAEVPLGAFLSGGLDSSTVVAVMSRLKQEPVKTFSVGFAGPVSHNELPYARALAQHYGTEHHEFLVKPNIVETVQEIVRYADEPFGISSAVPTYLLAKAAREHVTVVLTGDGGDEMFGGYPYYLYEQWAALYRRLPLAVDGLLKGSASLLGERVDGALGRLRSRVTRFTEAARQPPGERRLGWASGFSEREKRQLCAPFFHSALPTTTGFLEQQLCATLPPAAQQNCLDIAVWLADEMLCKVDRMTMAASLEARCPLLDWKLAEYTAGLSFDLKVPGYRTAKLKHLLRQAVADLLPPALLRRPKRGFNVPLDDWFRNGAKGYLHSVLSPARLRRRGLFETQEVTALLARHEAGQMNASNRLYALLVFETWAEQYL